MLCGFLLASFVVFRPALTGAFLSDDLNAIVSNDYVTGARSLVDIFTSFSWWGAARADAPGYRPLTTWTFAVNHDLAGASVASWHAINVVLHALVGWLVYLVGKELGGRSLCALGSASLFLLVPIHVEAVAWVVGRAELLAALAYAAGLLALLRYRRGGAPGYAVAAALLVALGTFAKENTATLLAAPVLAAWLLPGGARERRRDATALAMLTVGLVAYGFVRFAAGGPPVAAAAGDLLDNPLATLPVSTRLLGAISVFGRYVALTVWPASLSIDYSYDALGIGRGFLADRYSLVALIALLGLAVVVYSLGRRAAFALLLGASAYSLVSNLVFPIGTVMAERLFYLPTVGLALAVVPALDRTTSAAAHRAALIGVALLCLGYGVTSFRRAADWRDGVTIFESAARVHPRSARARMELGGAYGRAGRVEDAEREFARAVEILPSYAAAWYNLGNLRARSGRLDDAATAYGRALEHAPRLLQAWYNLGLVEQIRGRRDAAIEAFTRAGEIAPTDPEIARALAALRERNHDIANPPPGR